MTTEEQAAADKAAAEQKARDEQAARTKAELDRQNAAKTEQNAADAKAVNAQKPATEAQKADEANAQHAKAAVASGQNPAEVRRPAHEVEPPTVGVNNPNTFEARMEQHEKVDRELEERNRANEEGHQKNMDMINAKAEEAHARTTHADDPRAGHIPTGKEVNHNTPTILPDGTKVWN